MPQQCRMRNCPSCIPEPARPTFFAEQAFLSKTHAYKFARMAKFITGWASHLYYWVYPGLMVGVTAVLVGYLGSVIWPDTFNGSIFSPTLMILLLHRVFALFVAYIAYRGVVRFDWSKHRHQRNSNQCSARFLGYCHRLPA